MNVKARNGATKKRHPSRRLLQKEYYKFYKSYNMLFPKAYQGPYPSYPPAGKIKSSYYYQLITPQVQG